MPINYHWKSCISINVEYLTTSERSQYYGYLADIKPIENIKLFSDVK